MQIHFLSKLRSKKFWMRLVIIIVLATIVFGVGYIAGAAMGSSSFAQDGKVESTLLSEVKKNIDEKFVFWKASSTMPTDKEFEYGMIRGYVDTIKDPYTIFFPPKEAKSFSENVKGSFGGVGMQVAQKDKAIVVIAPLKDSPAMKAGIKAGDIIVAVDDKDVTALSSDDAVSMIRGPIDTKVKIGVIHPNEKKVTDIVIIRKEIKIPTIDTETKEGVFVIHLYNFSAESAELFRQALVKFVESKSKYLILDVRGNPGGYLEAAVSMASFFLPEGKVVLSEKQGKKEDVLNHRSTGVNAFANQNLKMVVLVDGGSASASEILAGALRDHGVAKVVGVKSFGKGSVQELIEFKDGSSLKVTVAKWYTPNGVSISEHGIVPDVEAVATTTMKDKKGNVLDSQLYKAIGVVKAMK